jgi:hypothetical protein
LLEAAPLARDRLALWHALRRGSKRNAEEETCRAADNNTERSPHYSSMGRLLPRHHIGGHGGDGSDETVTGDRRVSLHHIFHFDPAPLFARALAGAEKGKGAEGLCAGLLLT